MLMLSGRDPRHPSNRLYHGDVTGFEQAMMLVIHECQIEGAWTLVGEFDAHPDLYTPLTPQERAEYARQDAQQQASLAAYIQAARHALTLYRTAATPAEAVAALRAAKNPDLALIADALASGDYSTLAI